MLHDIYAVRLIIIYTIVSGLPFKVFLVREKGIETQGRLKMNCLAGRSLICVCFLENIQFPVCVGRERQFDVCSLVMLQYCSA